MPDEHAEFREIYSTVAQIVLAERDQKSGEMNLLAWLNAHSDITFPAKLKDKQGLRQLLEELIEDNRQEFDTDEFTEVLEQNTQGLLINIETGDVPDLIHAGYPWSDSDRINYKGFIPPVSNEVWTLDQLLIVLAGKTFDQMGYFEFCDLTDRLIETGDDWYTCEQGNQIRRVFLASLGTIAVIKTLRPMIEAGVIQGPLWLSASEGYEVYGAFTRIA
eukprot:g12525.t1